MSRLSMMAPVAALLPLMAVICMFAASGALRNPFRKPAPPSTRQCDIFLNRMIHKTHYESVRFVRFRIDCFLFDFKPWNPDGLETQVQYEFLDYTRTLDMTNQQAIVKLMIWLIQKNVKFRFRFQWNWSLPFMYNIRQVRKPKILRDLIASVDRGELMAYDLSRDTHALHP